jgi:hypothetical protein
MTNEDRSSSSCESLREFLPDPIYHGTRKCSSSSSSGKEEEPRFPNDASAAAAAAAAASVTDHGSLLCIKYDPLDLYQLRKNWRTERKLFDTEKERIFGEKTIITLRLIKTSC